ncbi:GNAT family N-acetyltransferase [Alteribacter aurantiacus]|uniref:GNAT family N-acetyltransferase n=1 Tax=Alteribacter aurantiacus TaxID=254410 RepID=UPI0004192EA7|nr:GNAT family N-acetyltransferase [Alteribacter aurantiacus]
MTLSVLKAEEVTPTMLDLFDRTQETVTVVALENDKWMEKEDSFKEQWSLTEKRKIVAHILHTINTGGNVVVAKEQDQVVGFAVLEAGHFGKTSVYKELSYLHVTKAMRGKGIGKQLFVMAKKIAKESGAEKLYIGAHPAIETQQFYKRAGCVPAKEIHLPIYERERRDIQLEAVL